MKRSIIFLIVLILVECNYGGYHLFKPVLFSFEVSKDFFASKERVFARKHK